LQKLFPKMNILSQIPYYLGKILSIFFIQFKVLKNHHNCLQYEKVFKVLYFHILNLAKYTYRLSSLDQHHKIEKKEKTLG
jgi:hypothetical protein